MTTWCSRQTGAMARQATATFARWLSTVISSPRLCRALPPSATTTRIRCPFRRPVDATHARGATLSAAVVPGLPSAAGQVGVGWVGDLLEREAARGRDGDGGVADPAEQDLRRPVDRPAALADGEHRA